MATTRKATRSSSTTKTASEGFTAEERDAMKQRAKEVRATKRRGASVDRADAEKEVLERIAEMPEADRAMAERVHAVIMAAAPDLVPRTWYGMPAYAKDGDVICHFQGAHKFTSRYATIGFSDKANLDDGSLWPVAFALTELSPAVEKRIGALVKQAVS